VIPLLLAQILGASLVTEPAPAVWTWGDKVQVWPASGGEPSTLATIATGPGGCSDGHSLFVMEHPGPSRFVRLSPPDWKPEVIEQETEFSDCLPANLYGRRGVLITHFFSQVRLYEEPETPGAPWTYTEIYSIYTASKQGGLILDDVDGDGLPDLYVGNYWARNPGQRGVAWRLHAINAYHDTSIAALARLALLGKSLAWAESEASSARLSIFSQPADYRQLWPEQKLLPPLDHPRGLAAAEGGNALVAGDRTHIVVWRKTDGEWQPQTLAGGFETLRLFVFGTNVLAVTPQGVRTISLQRRK
jgi:hypothetical protein